MRVFVTGASGFVGSAVVKELLANGHQVLGLVRSDSGAAQLAETGAEVYRGDVNDLPFIQKGAAACDAVIHTAFNHDFSRFKENCEDDRRVIEALGKVLAGTGKPLVITSAIGLLNNLGRLGTEDDTVSAGSDVIPRVASEEAAFAAAANGVNAYIVRLPPSVHAAGDHGFIPIIINLAREKKQSVYLGEGHNRWPAVHRTDAATLYRLIIEKQPDLKILHAIAEEGVTFKAIATAISEGLNIPITSKTGDAATAHFTWFAHFAALDCPASGSKTQQALGWEPKGPGLIDDIKYAGYLAG